MQPTRLIHGNKLTGYLANHDPKLIIRITNTAWDDNRDIQIYHNYYLELKIIIDSEAPTICTVQTQINMELVPQMNEEYFVQYIYVQ